MDTSNEYISRDKVLDIVGNYVRERNKSIIYNIFSKKETYSIYDKMLFLPITYVAKSQHWDFVINEERIGYWEEKITPLYYNGYKCSNCGHGGGESIPQSYGEMTEEEARVFFGDMNYKYCPNCGARMENGKDELFALID